MKKLMCLLLIFLTSMSFIYAQKNIKGKVTEVNGEPLPGVTILINGTNRGTVTNVNGEYQIEAQQKDAVLVFSFIGFEDQEIEIGNQTEINVVLKESIQALDEVVVVGYGTMKKSDLTGSVASVKSDDILETKSTSFVQGLEGRVSGVQVVGGSGAPGAESDIRIRGAVSINADSKPLYVIDGVQFDPNENSMASSAIVGDDALSPLAFINPSDIESVEVLKDASATAVFGSRGANGVIMITTKRGDTGKTSLSFDSYVSVSTLPKNQQIEMLSAGDFGDWVRYFETPGSNLTYWESLEPDANPKDLSSQVTRDWQDELLRTAITQNYSLAFNSSSKTHNIAGSVSYLDQPGIIENSDYNRITARFSGSAAISARAKIGGFLNFSNAVSNGVSEGGQTGRWAGAIKSIVMYNPLDPEYYKDDIDEITILSTPDEYVMTTERQNTTSRTMGNLFLEYEFFKGLTLKSTIGGNVSNSKLKEYYPSALFQGLGIGVGNIQNVTNNYLYNENILTYSKQFNKNHRINASFVFESRKNILERVLAANSDFAYEGNGADDLGAGALPSPPTSYKETVSNMASLARVNYFFMGGKYMFTGSIRADGSSKFHPDKQWGYFPSGAFAWRVSEEPFLKNNATVNNLKFRSSFGVTGNDRTPAFQYSPFYSSNLSVADDVLITTYKPAVLGNSELTWETSTQFNIGFDIGLFKERISLVADYYSRITDDMLYNATVPATVGFQTQWQNIGRIDNEGIELMLSGIIVSRANFTWQASVNATFQKSEVKSLGDVDYMDILFPGLTEYHVGRLAVGEQFGSYYGYEFDGIFQYSDFEEFEGLTNEEAAAIFDRTQAYTIKKDENGNPIRTPHAGNAVPKPGDMAYKDLDGDYLVDEVNDKTIIGNSQPFVFGGFSNSFKYKNFDFKINLSYSIGNEILNEGKVWLEGERQKALNVSQVYYNTAWRSDRPSNTTVSFDGYGRQNISSYYVEDGSYIKLQSVSLGYTLRGGFLKRINAESFRFYVNANNLITWTNYSGYKPEVNGPSILPGFDRFSYPNPLVITSGVNITF
jgi:TonB-dependent starch-binding outer membrane protein SusC